MSILRVLNKVLDHDIRKLGDRDAKRDAGSPAINAPAFGHRVRRPCHKAKAHPSIETLASAHVQQLVSSVVVGFRRSRDAERDEQKHHSNHFGPRYMR